MSNSSDHTSPNPELTLDDILNAGLNEVLDQNADADYFDMYAKLAKADSDAAASGHLAKSRALGFMAAITSMMLAPNEKAAPFQAAARWSNGVRSFLPEDLTVSQVNLLAQLAMIVNNQLLRARLADLVWMKDRRKGIAFPRMAIDAYRTFPIEADTWHLSGEGAWHRALQLAISIGPGAEDRVAEIERALLDAFDRSLGSDTFEPMWYVQPLFLEKRARADAPRIATEFERIGRGRLAAGRGSDAVDFFEVAEKWYERAQLSDKQAEMLIMIGSSWSAQSETATSAIVRQEFITRAIRAYREVPGACRAAHVVEEVIAELRTKLGAAGRLALGEMKVVEGSPVDLTTYMQEAVRRVRGETPMNALVAFCTVHRFPNRMALYQQAQDLVAQSLVGRLFGGVTFAGDGRAIARRAGADSGADAEAAQVAVRAIKTCVDLTAMIAHGMILPALDAMQLESYLTPLDFAGLAGGASLVPRDRVDVVAKGLHAGYCGDFVQAIHILVPQFEHMVRIVLQDAGAHTRTHDSDGLDMEIGLSTLVQRPQMITVFGEDLTFTIRSVMCEQDGPNLRNAVAHGMADSSLCNGLHGIYAWWLILRLIVQSFVAAERAEGESAESSAPVPEPGTES